MTQNIIRVLHKSWKQTKRTQSNKWDKNILFIEKNNPLLHICALQKYVNLCFLYLVRPHFSAITAGKVSFNCWSVLDHILYRTTSTLWCWWVSSFELLASAPYTKGPDHSKTLTLFFFNHSLVKWLVCLGSLSFCMAHFLLKLSSGTDVLIFSFRICWYISEFFVPSMMASRPGPDAAKQAQTMLLPPPCFTDGIGFLCWNAVFFFSNETLLI